MNRYAQEKWSWIEGTHGMRTQFLDALTDDNLTFNPGGANVTLGALCRESGDVEYAGALDGVKMEVWMCPCIQKTML